MKRSRSRAGKFYSPAEFHHGRRKADRSWFEIGKSGYDDDADSGDYHVMEDNLVEFTQAYLKPEDMRSSIDSGIQAFESLNQRDSVELMSRVSAFNKDAQKGTLPIEWYTFRMNSPAVGFDLEMWWRRSIISTRLAVIVLVFSLVIAIAHVLFAIWLISVHFLQTVDSPYLCLSEECQQATTWMTSTMNQSVDPCDNFYEFMCGNTKEEDLEDLQFESLISNPGFKLELGQDSLLSKILKDFKNEETHDQSIRYYQSCLDEETKKEKGLDALLQKIKYIFGTDDFTKFNDMTEPSLEVIGGRVFQTVGHAYFLNIVFFTFPFIQMLRPAHTVYWAEFKEGSSNKIYVEKALNYLMPQLGLPKDSEQIKDMVNGVGFWSDLVNKIYNKSKDSPGDLEVGTDLPGMCPPMVRSNMGLGFNYTAVLEYFFQRHWREDQYDSSTRKYWKAIGECFQGGATTTPSFSYLGHEFKHTRLAFVSMWIFGLFHDAIIVLDKDFVLNFIDEEEFERLAPYSKLVNDLSQRRHTTIEYKCMEELWRSLGYLPCLRYLMGNIPDPVDFLESRAEDMYHLYEVTREQFMNIPKSNIDRFMHRQSHLILSRELHSDVLMHIVGDILDTFPDKLEFGDNHLFNHYIALNLTVESGRLYWLGSTDSVAVPKWWGYGEPENMRDQLLELRLPLINPARFEETEDAFTKGKFLRFLGRKDPNYILFSLALFNEPFVQETLALRSAGTTLKIIRSILSLVERITHPSFYPYYNDHYDDPNMFKERRDKIRGKAEDYDPQYPVNNGTCNLLMELEPGEMIDEKDAYRTQSYKTQEMSSNLNPSATEHFMNIMMLEIAFDYFKKREEQLYNREFTGKFTKYERDLRLHRRLPGEIMGKYNEDQLFFMAFVRHVCESSWKKKRDYNLFQRYNLEVTILNALMHHKTFLDVWNCPEGSQMRRFREQKCFEEEEKRSSKEISALTYQV